jgi:glucose-6-phosphate isomerase
MNTLSVDIAKALPFLPGHSIDAMQPALSEAHEKLLSGSGKGNEFLGWLRLPSSTDNMLLASIQEDARQLAGEAEVVVVIGIGGSYLGARAAIEALQHSFSPLLKKKGDPLVVYAGENLSEDYHADLLDVLNEKSYALIVISKSGTTTEPAVAFRILKEHLEKKYGTKIARRRIIAITDASRGALKKIADDEGYRSYVIPDDVGGRYSVLTPVGLLPVAVAGFDINELMEGARQMQHLCFRSSVLSHNPASVYAAARNLLYRSGKQTEIMVTWQPQLLYVAEWWKQLFGESEGKEGKGIFPASVNFTTDLHSLGQFIQEGTRNLFETVLSVEHPAKVVQVPPDPVNGDGLNFIAGRRLSEVNRMAELGTLLAHIDGGVPNIRISMPGVTELHLGQLLYFYEFSCALSGYVLGVNPFDQPGVEAYKNNMYALLGKPGYEEEGKKLRLKLK